MSLKSEPTYKTEVKQKSMSVLKWMKIDPSGSKPTPRHGHRAVAMKDLLIVLFGGDDGIIDELHVYNTTNNHWFTPQISGDKPPGSAAYGLVVDNTRLLLFGGMLEYGKYSDELYELQTSKWHWSKLKPRPPLYRRSPCPRLGHSFTLIGNIVYLFGGIANITGDSKNNIPLYLNDLYTLNISSPDTLAWDVPEISGNYPPPRESHSAVAYTNSRGKSKLIIYGGMNMNRLGDIWILDIDTMSWDSPIVLGPLPLPRSLHTAITVQNCMFVFGGWIPDLNNGEKIPLIQKKWVCSNWFGCLNLETMTWKELNTDLNEENVPKARAGHCAVCIETKMYIWSGRSGHKTLFKNQVCHDDFWFIELAKPQKCTKLLCIGTSENALEIKYNIVPKADACILQIMKYDLPNFIAAPTSSEMASLLPFTTSESAKRNNDSEDCQSVSTITKSADTPAKPNDKIVILPQGSSVNLSSLIEDEQFNLVTAQAPGNIQTKSIQSTFTKPSLLQNFKALSPVMPKNTASTGSRSTDLMLSDSAMNFSTKTKSADIPAKLNKNIKILPISSTINSLCFIKDQQFTPVTAQETIKNKIKTVHNTEEIPLLPHNTKAERSKNFENTVFLKSSSMDIMLSDSSKHTPINTKSATKLNEDINVLSHGSTINTLCFIKDQQFTPVTAQETVKNKIKTVHYTEEIPLLPHNTKAERSKNFENTVFLKSSSMDIMLSDSSKHTPINTKSATKLNEDINVLSHGSTINTLCFIKDQQFTPVTAQETVKNKIKTVHFTEEIPLLPHNTKAERSKNFENTVFLKSSSMDIMLSDSSKHTPINTKSATKLNEDINVLSHGSTINTLCFIKDQQFTPVTAQETVKNKIKTVHFTEEIPLLPHNTKAERSKNFENTVFLKSSSMDIMLSDSSKHTPINTKSATKLNEDINVLSHGSTINTLCFIKDQQFTPVTVQKPRNKKIKTVQSTGCIPLIPQNVKGVNLVTPKSSALLSSLSMDMLSNVSTSQNFKSSIQKELPKPDIKISNASFNIVQTLRSIKDVYPVDTTVPQHQAVSINRPVLQTSVAETVPKTKSNVLGKRVVLKNLGDSQSNFVKIIKTSQGNQANQKIQIGKIIGTSTSSKPSILKFINPDQQSSQIKTKPLMKTVPLKTVNVKLPVAVNKSTFNIKKGNPNILASPQIRIITTGSHLSGIQTFPVSQAHITNHTSVSKSPVQMEMVSSDINSLARSDPIIITMAEAGYHKMETSDKSNLKTIDVPPLTLKKVGGQNNMDLLTSNSGGHVHMKNIHIVSKPSTPISQINSKVSSSVKVSTNLPTKTRSVLTRLAVEAGIINSTNTCTHSIEESTDYLMEGLDCYIQKENPCMTAEYSTESILTQLAMEAAIVDLTNTITNNRKESTMGELENLIQEENVDCV